MKKYWTKKSAAQKSRLVEPIWAASISWQKSHGFGYYSALGERAATKSTL